MQKKLITSSLVSALMFTTAAGAQTNPIQTRSAAVPLPKTMISMGDSITAGALANLSRSAFYNPFYLLRLLATLAEIAINWDIYSGVQDRYLSWSTGLDSNFSVKSQAHRLAYLHAKAGTQMYAGSVSWSGDSSFELAKQVDYALDWSKTRSADGGPEYVTLMIGANDVCGDSVADMSSDRDYYNNVDTAVSRLVNANPNAHIMISSLPDINSLSNVAKRSRLLGFGPYARCEDVWRKTNLCYTLTRRPAGSLEEKMVTDKVNAINRMLKEIATRVNAQTHRKTVIFAEHTFDRKFTDKDISIDCFHPNKKGQNIIAASTWNDSFWANGWSESTYDKYITQVKRARARKNANSFPLFRR